MNNETTQPFVPENINDFRTLFPILAREVNGKQLVYLDNAATTQKPTCVLNALEQLYTQHNANIHRGAHRISRETTDLYEQARLTTARYLGTKHHQSLIFTPGTTAAINLAAQSLALAELFSPRNAILVSIMEHHSNLLPWQLLAQRHNLELIPIPLDQNEKLDLNAAEHALKQHNGRIRLMAVTHVSNTLGAVNNPAALASLAHKYGALLLMDGAQGVKHGPITLDDWDVDLYAFSGHKIYGPTGIGVLWAKPEIMEKWPPVLGGGEMVDTVTFQSSTYAPLPQRLEAGTPPFIQAIALAKALNFYQSLNVPTILLYEQTLLKQAYKELQKIDGLRILSPDSDTNAALVSFTVDGVHHYDLALMLDQAGIAVRSGLHCTEPIHTELGITGTTRASFAPYNTLQEVDYFTAQTARIIKTLRR